MRIGIIPQTIWERIALAAGRIPEPIVEAFPPLVLARSIMAATRLGIFAELAEQPLSAAALADACRTESRATGALLAVLASAGYVCQQQGIYRLTGKARHWLRPDSPADVSAYLNYNYLQWEWVGELERFLQTGLPLDIHTKLTRDDWKHYERGMYTIARLVLPEVLWRARLPTGARTLLDIGGGHGLAATNFCRRHTRLHCTVLDLPAAMAGAPPLAPDVAGRIARVAGDALTTELGCATYDVIYMANLVHHFTAPTMSALAGRIARALRPGGIWIIQDGVRSEQWRQQSMAAAIGDLYFALTSASGFWSFTQMAAWQADAGLQPQRPIHLLTAPGQGLQIALKSR